MASNSPSSLWVTGEENGFPRPFGNYLLLAAFAQGGMGELFLAMNGSIAGAFRLCVVKKLRADLTNDKEYVNRFVDEAKVVVQLNHANISHVFDIGRIDGQYYLAMEYVSGVSVKKLMSRAEELNTKIPQDIAVLIAREVLEALDYAHAHTHPITGEDLQVVHRDVSPQNVLVSWAGEVKLIDFGLALSALKDEHTATGAVMGKVAYMPPEQARGDEVSAACDQFSTAVVAYEMLAGDRYHGDLPLHAIWAIAGMGNFPPPKWNLLPKDLQIILQRALHNDPFRRYPTCGDLREALGAYMAAHHPATSGRNLRDLLGEWFREYRADERELLAQFRDVTGSKVREAVKATVTTAESLVSGPHARPEAWQMPPTEPDAKSVSGSGPKAPSKPARPPASSGPTPSSPSPAARAALDAQVALAAQATGALPLPAPLAPPPGAIPENRFEQSTSMRLMPPPAGVGAPSVQLVAAASSLLRAGTLPSILAPPAPGSTPSSPSAASPSSGALSSAVSSTVSPLASSSSSSSSSSSLPSVAALAAPLASTGALAPSTALPPVLVPIGPMDTVGESTERFLMRGAAAPVATLTPRSTGTGQMVSTVVPPAAASPPASATPSMSSPLSTVGEPTERLVREAREAANLATLTPTNAATSSVSAPAPLPPPAQPPVTQPVAAVTSTIPPPMSPQAAGPMGTSAVSRHESTERVRKRDDDDGVDELAFGRRRSNMLPIAASLAGVAAVAIAVIVVATSGEKKNTGPEDDTNVTVPVNTKPIPPNDVVVNNTNVDVAPHTDDPPVDAAPNVTGTVKVPIKKDPKKNPNNTPNNTTPNNTTPKNTGGDDAAREATRTRERVDALKRSSCSHACVARIVGQLETMPGAAALPGFRKSVNACVDACGAK